MLLFFKSKNSKRVCFLAFCTTFAKFVTFVTTFGAPSKFVSLVEKDVSRQLQRFRKTLSKSIFYVVVKINNSKRKFTWKRKVVGFASATRLSYALLLALTHQLCGSIPSNWNSRIHVRNFPYLDKFPFWINYLNNYIKNWLGQRFPETL